MGINSSKSSNACYYCLADPNNLQNNHYPHFFSRNHVEYIQFLMQQPAFREHMWYAPSKELNGAEEHIYSHVNQSTSSVMNRYVN